ncbi:MAG: pilus assembly protein PilM [Planctomycetes bacterium]|nr:pilus assembly protein PilM [Planctomycetota bacterium]
MARFGMGIDLGSDSVKIVQGRFRGETFHVVKARRLRLPPGEDHAAFLKRTLAGEGFRGAALLGLTGKDIIIRYTQVPPVTPQRLKTLMDFEVSEIIAQSGGDVVADYALLPLDEGSEEEELVLLGLVKDAFLSARMEALKALGIRVQGACPNALGLFNCFLKNGDFRSEELTLLLNLGAENCDIALQKNAQLIFARNQSLGGRAFTRAIMEGLGVDEVRAERLKQLKADLTALLPGRRPEQAEERLARTLVGPAGRLFSMVQSTLTFAKNQSKMYNLKLGRVLLSGGGSRLRGLDAYLSQNLGVPVERFDPLPRVDLSALAPESAREVAGHGAELAVALGLAEMAVDPRFFRITLLPEKVRKRLEFRRSTAFLIAAGVAIVCFLGLSFFKARTENAHAAAWQRKVSEERHQRDKHLRDYREVERANRELAEKVDRLARRRNFGAALVKAWRAVEKHLPAEFWIRELKLESVPFRAIGEEGTRASRSPAVPVGRSARDAAPPGPEIPTLVVVGAGRQTGRQLVPALNDYVAALREEEDIRLVQRTDKLGAGQLEFTLYLHMVAPPAAPEPVGDKDGQQP